VVAVLIVGCGSASPRSESVSSRSGSASSVAAFKSCEGTAANGYLKNLQVKIVSCTAGVTVMNSYAKVFLDNGSRPPSVVNVQGFSCVDDHPNGDTRIDDIVCAGTGDNSAVKFGGRSNLPQPSG
jgi:hypothetical protein